MKKMIFIAGGGTGGHIYPGIAIAEALQKHNPDVEVHFVGTTSGLEVSILKKEGWPLHVLPIGKLNFRGRYFEKIKTLLKLPLAILKSIQILWRYQPIFVLGVGGYASGPFVLTASFLGFNSGLWEPNAMPGLANRWLSRFVDVGFIVFKGATQYLKCSKLLNLGMPVRSQIESSPVDVVYEKKNSDYFTVLIFGGSQGARSINAKIFELVTSHAEELRKKKIKFIHQTGKWDWEMAQKIYSHYTDIVEAHEFIFDMPKYYQLSDMAICRAGASSIAELSAFGLVPILIPLPLADSHQEANAQEVVNEKAAILILQKDLSVEKLLEEIEGLRLNPERRKVMSQKLRSLHKRGAADRIAKAIYDQVNL
jgi:UDP-N-acetylglucosamine--N-acetylmuramyl-(pentapeptide) pyrophosphoryl-undecaprenol N-acetylglucosamine transferase